MKNVEFYTLKDGRFAFVIDPDQNFGPSKSGKSIVIACNDSMFEQFSAELPDMRVNIMVVKLLPKPAAKVTPKATSQTTAISLEDEAPEPETAEERVSAARRKADKTLGIAAPRNKR